MTRFRHVRIRDVKPGDRLRADGGFTCIPDGAVRTVSRDAAGELFIRCKGPDGEGKCGHRHHLEGQRDRGRYIGLEKVGS